MYITSENYAIIGSINDFMPFQNQAIIQINDGLFLFRTFLNIFQ